MKVSVSKVKNGVAASAVKASVANSQPSFNGKIPTTATKSLKELLDNAAESKYPWLVRDMIKKGKNNGEILNTLVTGFGTAFVAPIFIVWNPLAKADKETRTYSAWRQPISAVLAVITQIAVNKKFNNWMEKQASTGVFDRMDLRGKPTVSYLKTLIKHQHPDWKSKEVDAEVKRMQEKARWDKINQARNSKEYIQKVDNANWIDFVDKDHFNKAKSLVEKDIAEQVNTMRKNGATGSQIRDFKKAHGKKYITEQAYQKAAEMIEHEVTINAKIKHTIRQYQKADDYLSAFAAKTARKASPADLKLIDTIEKSADTNSKSILDIVNRFGEFKKANKGKSLLDMAIQETEQNLKRILAGQDVGMDELGNMHLMEKLEKLGKSSKEFIQDAAEHLADSTKYELSSGSKPFGSVKKLGDTFEDIFRSVKIKKLVEKELSDAANVLKDQKTKWGIVVSLVTLPFSCGLLNWVYPRLMEKIMPETAKKKQQAQKKMEASA